MRKRIAVVSLVACVAAWGVCAQEEPGQQVNVSAKIIEFRAIKGIDTGLSTYFKRSEYRKEPFGAVIPSVIPGVPDRSIYHPGRANHNALQNADITFPADISGGITVYFDRISLNIGDIEAVLQAMVSQNRASILSQPRALVAVGSAVPTVIKTTDSIPYSDTQVVGQTPVRIISFREVGVSLSVTCPQVIDDDGNPNTSDDTYIQLTIDASFLQKASPRTIQFATSDETYTVWEFASRSIKTSVWLRHGQVLVLGGLYKNKVDRKITSLPGLDKGESMVLGAVDRVVPAQLPAHPVSSLLGNRHSTDERQELVFIIRADFWRYSYAMPQEFRFGGFGDEEGGDLSEDVLLDLIGGGGSLDIEDMPDMDELPETEEALDIDPTEQADEGGEG